MQTNSLITIITVSYNAQDTIENTIKSVINQTYPNIEYIIIDGGSDDKTINIIKKYSDRISFWISEPDKGIYDAMNKGIKLAQGEWINFMNCGDTFYSNNIIKDIINKININSDIIYGDTNIIRNFGSYIKKSGRATLQNYMPFGHQASFVKNSILKKYKFDLSYKICADRNFFYHVMKDGYNFEYINLPISNYEADNGFSANNIIKLMSEIGLIEGKSEKLSWKIKMNLFKINFKIKRIIEFILPNFIVQKIKKSRVVYLNKY